MICGLDEHNLCFNALCTSLETSYIQPVCNYYGYKTLKK